jgi:hypothetical protein
MLSRAGIKNQDKKIFAVLCVFSVSFAVKKQLNKRQQASDIQSQWHFGFESYSVAIVTPQCTPW